MSIFGTVLFSAIILMCSVSAALAETSSILLGAIYSTTGTMSSLDKSSLRGVQIAVKQINDSGGLLGGRKVTLLSENSRSEERASALAAMQLLERKVSTCIGHNDPNFVYPSAAIFQKNGIPFITSGATLPDLPERIGDCLFMVAFGDDHQAYAIADFATEKLKKSRALVIQNNSCDYARALSDYFQQRFTDHGGEIVYRLSYLKGQSDFYALSTELQKSNENADVIFVAGWPDDTAPVVEALRKAGFSQPILGGDAFDTPLLNAVNPKYGKDVYFANHLLRFDAPQMKKFARMYERAYGELPESTFAALGYDSVMLWAEAVTRAGTDDPEKIKNTLAKVNSFMGLTGKISYTRNWGVAEKDVAIVKLANNKTKQIYIWNPATAQFR